MKQTNKVSNILWPYGFLKWKIYRSNMSLLSAKATCRMRQVDTRSLLESWKSLDEIEGGGTGRGYTRRQNKEVAYKDCFELGVFMM